MRGTSRPVKYELRGYRFVKDPWARLSTGLVDLRWSAPRGVLEGESGGALAVSAQALNRGGPGGPVTLSVSGSALELGLVELEHARLYRQSDASSKQPVKVGAGFRAVPKHELPLGSRGSAVWEQSALILSAAFRVLKEGQGRLGFTLHVRGQSAARTVWFDVDVKPPRAEAGEASVTEEWPMVEQTYQRTRAHQLAEARALLEALRRKFPDSPTLPALEDMVSRAEAAG